MKVGYILYHAKSFHKIEIRDIEESGHFPREKFTDEVKYLFSGYYGCKNKEPLIDFANIMKHQWISEAESEIEKLKNIKFE